MMTYKIKIRRKWFWKTYVVTGHRFEAAVGKMVLFFPDGSLREIARWNECEMILGTDWVLAAKKQMEAEAAQAIPLAVGGH
jgi:hypothetical protein